MQTLNLVRVLVSTGYRVTICCYYEYDAEMVRQFEATGAEILLMKYERATGLWHLTKGLIRLFKEQKPDIVHVQYLAPGFVPVFAGWIAGVKTIFATVHQPGTPHSIKNHLLLRFGAMLTNHFICVSEAAEKSWFGNSCLIDMTDRKKIKGKRHFTIPNGVDIEGLDTALAAGLPKVAEITDSLKENQVIGTVARLSMEKGIDILLEAFALVYKEFHQSKLLIVGDGNQSAELKTLANRLGISNAITWTGQLSWHEAMGCIGHMDIVVVPSRFEGFGLTAVEAMACGKPVVASRVDGLAEIIQDGITGVLVPSEEPRSLASTLIRLLKDKECRHQIGIVARKHVEEDYSYLKFRERCRVIYALL
ncbi:glycosyl transferase [hydrocarbon metagenome]|uniref:Glycosyl transferase n=1 Tax=hydrocarbon metagenome TaxID=938273 RepID=A0A0W8FPN5_9ZZZZ